MLNPNPYMMLATTLGFSAADLNANRLGVLTPFQRQKLLSQRLVQMRWPGLVLLFLGTMGYALQIELLFMAFVGAVLITVLIAIWQRFQDDLTLPVEGVVGQIVLRPLPLGRYVADVNGCIFNLSKPLAAIFHGDAHYRLYYTAGTHTILSAELV